jgi:hypothetical protein
LKGQRAERTKSQKANSTNPSLRLKTGEPIVYVESRISMFLFKHPGRENKSSLLPPSSSIQAFDGLNDAYAH